MSGLGSKVPRANIVHLILVNFLLDPEIISKTDPYESHFSSFNQSETTLFKLFNKFIDLFMLAK